jgi:hypothetical protein
METCSVSYVYPTVLDEFATIAELLKGRSIARFGDGEFKLVDGFEQVREPKNPKLSSELRSILRSPDKRCIVGVPTMNEKGPKIRNWKRHYDRFAKLMRKGQKQYYSAFISRPDSAPWINNIGYAQQVQKLWLGKNVVVVCEAEGSMMRAVRFGAARINHIVCPSHKTYAELPRIEPAVLAARPDIAILSCGPAATCLAHRLARQGLQAIDLGSGGAFLAKLLASCDQ